MNRRKMFGSLAAVAGGLLLTATAFGQDKEKKKSKAGVKCAGINECKGKGECGAADGSHSCKGKNECKGKGWVNAASEKACTGKKGTVVKDAKKA
jgi:hypothetical protein